MIPSAICIFAEMINNNTVQFHVFGFSPFVVDVPDFCFVHKNEVLPDWNNCAKYYNCSDQNGLHMECSYPELFSDQTRSCENFTTVACTTRKEPQAPCGYIFVTMD